MWWRYLILISFLLLGIGCNSVAAKISYEVKYIPFDIQFFTPVTIENFDERSKCTFNSEEKNLSSFFESKDRKKVVALIPLSNEDLRIKIIKHQDNKTKATFINSDKGLILDASSYILTDIEFKAVMKLIDTNCKL